jgi:hypothetical protein
MSKASEWRAGLLKFSDVDIAYLKKSRGVDAGTAVVSRDYHAPLTLSARIGDRSHGDFGKTAWNASTRRSETQRSEIHVSAPRGGGKVLLTALGTSANDDAGRAIEIHLDLEPDDALKLAEALIREARSVGEAAQK